MTRVLVTGADGFIGSALCKELQDKGFEVIKALRNLSTAKPENPRCKAIVIGEIDGTTDWQAALNQVDVIVHLAARVHVPSDHSELSCAEFRKTNLEGTVNLARQAVNAGVKRFIFISSIKVNGETTAPGSAFTAEDIPTPSDAYGISKRDAEESLRTLALESGMETVIIRPPIVYGPGVKANFLALMHCLCRNIPLPLGAVNNRRSILALDNLVDLIITCITHPAAANQTFLASDGQDLTTTELLQRLALALNKKALLLPVPVALLKPIASLLGKKEVSQKLCGNLQIDMRKTRELLGWIPRITIDEGLRRTAEHYLNSR